MGCFGCCAGGRTAPAPGPRGKAPAGSPRRDVRGIPMKTMAGPRKGGGEESVPNTARTAATAWGAAVEPEAPQPLPPRGEIVLPTLEPIRSLRRYAGSSTAPRHIRIGEF
jgi:hypothetical protein